jgi:uncharacterized protein (DUF924 family)
MERIDTILQFWFEEITDATRIDKNKSPFRNWFAKNDIFDSEIKRNFENDLLAAAKGEYSSWLKDPRGVLALIILFDQFSRNIYRGTARSFEFDPL